PNHRRAHADRILHRNFVPQELAVLQSLLLGCADISCLVGSRGPTLYQPWPLQLTASHVRPGLMTGQGGAGEPRLGWPDETEDGSYCSYPYSAFHLPSFG